MILYYANTPIGLMCYDIVFFTRLLADQQVSEACLEFVSHYKKTLVEKNLIKNFLQHLVNLQEFQLISPSILHQASSILLQSEITSDTSSDSR